MAITRLEVPGPDGMAPSQDLGEITIDVRLVRGFVVWGVVLRVAAYLVDFPLWWDEALVAVNFLRRGYLDLLRPLDGGQVAPLLFLWLELTSVKLLGFSEWSLRLVPMVCGVASVPLFGLMVKRVATPRGSLIALAVFACSSHPIRHSADLKPYSIDLLMALVLQWLAFRWLDDRARSRRFWALTAVVPVALLASHPAILVASGLAVALAWPAWRSGRWSVRLAYGAYVLAVFCSYVAAYVLFASGQASAASPGMRAMWAKSFPPHGSVVELIRWFWTVHSGDMLAYPCGGERGGSTLSLILALVGVATLVHQRRSAVVTVILAPMAVAIGAATLRLYPYGGPAPHGSAARVMQYAAPGLCLLIGLGGDRLLASLSSWRLQRRILRLGLAALVGVGLVTIGSRIHQPYRAYHAQASREFAREFWPSLGKDAEVLDLRWDLPVAPWDSIQLGTAVMLCNEAIYSPSRLRGGPAWSAVSATRPLRCVLGVAIDRDKPRLARWLDSMNARFDLRDQRSITIETAERGLGRASSPERYEVFEFVPKAR